MADLTENLGLNVELTGSETDYQDLLDENWIKLDAAGWLCVDDQLVLADLPTLPQDGKKYIVDGEDIYIGRNSNWDVIPLQCGRTFYDKSDSLKYFYDGITVEPEEGQFAVIDGENVGATGEGIFKQKFGNKLQFKKLIAGLNVLFVITPDGLEVQVPGASPEFSSGDKLVFPQATAPVGWTIDATINDRFLRVSNSAGGVSGGAFSNLSHTHTMANHTHNQGNLFAEIGEEVGGTNRIVYSDSGNTFVSSDRWATGGISMDTTNSSSDTAVDVTGDTGDPDPNTTDARTITHGSAQHAYHDVIIAAKD